MAGHVEEAVALDEDALATWPEDKHQPERAEVLAWAGLHNYWLGGYERSVERSRAAQEVARRVPNLFGFVVGGSHAGLGLTGLGRHEEALKVLDETIVEAREIELTPIFTLDSST